MKCYIYVEVRNDVLPRWDKGLSKGFSSRKEANEEIERIKKIFHSGNDINNRYHNEMIIHLFDSKTRQLIEETHLTYKED